MKRIFIGLLFAIALGAVSYSQFNTVGPGTPGAQWYTSNGVPSNSLYSNGDWDTDVLTGNCYRKQNGVWVFQMNINGSTGPQGNGFGANVTSFYDTPTTTAGQNLVVRAVPIAVGGRAVVEVWFVASNAANTLGISGNMSTGLVRTSASVLVRYGVPNLVVQITNAGATATIAANSVAGTADITITGPITGSMTWGVWTLVRTQT